MRPRIADDRGFTLIELLISVVITGLIVASIGGTFIVFMRSTGQSQDHQAIARDQFSLSSWFLADAQSSTAEDVVPEATVSCLGVPAFSADSSRNVVQLRWRDLSTTMEYEANYRAIRPSPTELWQLVRFFCQTGSAATNVTVVHSLAMAPAPLITEEAGRLAIRLRSSIDGVSDLAAAGTRHVVLVPDVVGLSEAAAVTAIGEAGLVAAIETEFDEVVPIDDVVVQDPLAGAPVGRGSTVTITVSLGPVLVPDVVGLSEAAAVTAIEDAELVAAIETAFDEVVPSGYVVSQDPLAGTPVGPGSTVTITVSLGPDSSSS